MYMFLATWGSYLGAAALGGFLLGLLRFNVWALAVVSSIILGAACASMVLPGVSLLAGLSAALFGLLSLQCSYLAALFLANWASSEAEQQSVAQGWCGSAENLPLQANRSADSAPVRDDPNHLAKYAQHPPADSTISSAIVRIASREHLGEEQAHAQDSH